MPVVKHSDTPDQRMDLPDGSIVKHLHLDPATVSVIETLPGWQWSKHVKPRVCTEHCEKEHIGYMLEGKMAVQMTGGDVEYFEKGDAVHILPGHDGWVVGEEKAVMVEFTPKEKTPYAVKKD